MNTSANPSARRGLLGKFQKSQNRSRLDVLSIPARFLSAIAVGLHSFGSEPPEHGNSTATPRIHDHLVTFGDPISESDVRTDLNRPKPLRGLLIGAGKGANNLVRELRASPDFPLVPVAAIDDEERLVGTFMLDVPVIGTTGCISAIAQREQIAVIVIAIPSAGPLARNRLVNIGKRTGLPVLICPTLGELLSGTRITDLRTTDGIRPYRQMATKQANSL